MVSRGTFIFGTFFALALLFLLVGLFRKGLSDKSWTDESYGVATEEVAKGNEDVLLVYHEHGKAGWKFFGIRKRETKPIFIEKSILVARDSTIIQLMDLPAGWKAERKSRFDVWQRTKL